MRTILLGTICLIMIASCKNEAEKATPASTAIASETTKTPPPVEFADQKYVDMGKKSLAAFASGDIDGWVSGFADNVVLRWSSGDSLAGKEAIAKYWKDRRMNVVKSLETSKEIWLPVKVNQPQSVETQGTWLLSWYQVKATYKNNESLTFWVHIDMHYNNEMKVDEMIQYVDRAPINAAIAKKK
ncbi:hypothetical protein A3860_31785 [Niastella vici]|uniref:SnoaL-like domain-containing protein n=1 Tax=Niastella vici TaxID=1703345 RepID=A0A1V9FSZ7_9BACT|nr:nuclear transport factor 2 family protein [Niastella vici]OQP61509.1 hypothetical protein A3860_31785 [Niastella vici]